MTILGYPHDPAQSDFLDYCILGVCVWDLLWVPVFAGAVMWCWGGWKWE